MDVVIAIRSSLVHELIYTAIPTCLFYSEYFTCSPFFDVMMICIKSNYRVRDTRTITGNWMLASVLTDK